MDGFFPFSEETTRGPTPPDPAMAGAHHHHGHGHGHGHQRPHGGGDIAGGLKIQVGSSGGGGSHGNGAAGMAAGPSGGHGGVNYADQAGTPSASLVGNRAKMR